jgi:hypothetical protein
MATARLTFNMAIGGRALTGSSEVEDESVEIQDITLPAGIAGTLTTRTDANTGVVTVASGHGITGSDTVMVSWVGGLQRVVDVTATTSTTISIDLGVGDDLPIATTSVVVSKSVVSSLEVSELKAIAVKNVSRVYLDILDGSSGSLKAKDIPAGEGYFWMTNIGFADPTDSDAIGSVKLNNLSTVADTVVVAVLKNTV